MTAQPPSQPYDPRQSFSDPDADPTVPPRGKGLAIAALVLGVLPFIVFVITIVAEASYVPAIVFGIGAGIVAVALGIVALVRGQFRGMSIAGIVFGALSVILAGGVAVIAAALTAMCVGGC